MKTVCALDNIHCLAHNLPEIAPLALIFGAIALAGAFLFWSNIK